MAFAKDEDSDEDVALPPPFNCCPFPPITEEADVDWKADEEEAGEDNDELAVVTVLLAPLPFVCPALERNEELRSLDKSVLVLLAAVTSAASLPTRTVQGAEGDQWRTPKPASS